MENITDIESVDGGVFPPKEPNSPTHTYVNTVESQSKTPSASDAQTPRRSSRKSVRPPLDYEDIMLRSASKATTARNNPEATENQNDDVENHKWSVAEVGRHSAKVKRSRKSKRTTIAQMQIKEEMHVDADSDPKLEDQNNIQADQEVAKQVLEFDVKSKDQTIEDTDTEEPAVQVPESDVKSKGFENIKVEANSAERIHSENFNDMETEAKLEGQIQECALKSEDMEELGICPLEFGEEMPSLIVLDDDVINTTFDADAKEDKEVSIIDMPILQVSPEKNPSIKVILTNNADQESILLNADQTGETKRSRTIRLPTPFKTKVVKKLPNSPGPTTYVETVGDNGNRRRRSRSFSTMKEIKNKTVSFLSPIEVAHVNDIDKRWEDLSKNNITVRRKRSMSVDEILPKPSRLPQPKHYPKIFTPSKLNTRTKLPNFAAMHQKQFDKMENLVDHLERKAERAKALTNSALKQKQTSDFVKTLPDDGSRQPRSLKKIDLSTTVQKFQEQRHRRVQTPIKGATPSKSKANVVTRAPLINENSFATKPAFNLSTSLAKTFHANTMQNPMPSSKGGNKVEQRRQRHMEMFKGRTAKDTKGDFIRGVRLNRRFELQMQHRRFMEEED